MLEQYDPYNKASNIVQNPSKWGENVSYVFVMFYIVSFSMTFSINAVQKQKQDWVNGYQ